MDCPTADVVAAFVAGRLAPEEICRIEAHAAGCNSCLDLLALAMRGDGNAGSSVASATGPGLRPLAPLLGPSLPVGATVGRYLILDLVGRGGMGEVYAAYDPELDRRVAVKLLSLEPTRVSAAEGRARLLREAKAIARLSHPNVVVVHDAGVWQDRVFIAMEFVEGATLAAWLKREKRTWRRIRDVFVEAGRGLAAAHAAGLVHRDFKPQNVMVGRDGRVRVADFGLVRDLVAAPPAEASGPSETHAPAGPPASENATQARTVETRAAGAGLRLRAVPDPAETEPAPTTAGADPHTVDGSLTRTGTLIGTPTYMAPEQSLGQVADIRSDQFSFCVALYEGLYGERPFQPSSAEQSVSDLRAAVLSGRVGNASDSTGVPAWLRRALLRGLQLRREARYPSMDDLLGALRRDPGRRARRLATAGAVAAALIGVGIVGARLLQRSERLCQGGGEKVAAVWDTSAPAGTASRRSAIERAFLATKLPLAPETWRRIAAGLDQYANRWIAAYVDACQATHVRGEQSAEALDLRMACLGERLGGLRALTDTLVTADATTVVRAVDAVEALGGLDRCADLPALRAVVPPPSDPRTRALVASVRARFAAVRALRDVGRTREALAAGRPLVAEARAIGYPALTAEMLVVIGWLEGDLPEDPASVATLTEAYFTAERARDDETRADAAVQLVGTAAALARIDEGERWARIGDSLLARLGPGHDRLRAWLLNNRSNVLASVGDVRGALELNRQALLLKEKALGPDSPDVAVSLSNIVSDLVDLDEGERAVEFADRGLAVARRAYGDAHPLVAQVSSNRGEALNKLHRYGEARAAFQASLDRWIPSLGPEHQYAAYPLTGLGETELGLGHPQAALVSLERAFVIREKHEPDPVLRAQTQFPLARALWESGGDRARARTLAAQARDTYAKLPRFAVRRSEIDAWLASHPAEASPARIPRGGGKKAKARTVSGRPAAAAFPP